MARRHQRMDRVACAGCSKGGRESVLRGADPSSGGRQYGGRRRRPILRIQSRNGSDTVDPDGIGAGSPRSALFIARRLMTGTPSATHSAIALSDASRLPLGAEECRGGDCLHVAAASASLRLTAANSSLIYYSTHHTVAGRPLPCYVEPQLALTSPRASTKYALQLEMRRLPRSTCSGNFALTAISGPSFFFE